MTSIYRVKPPHNEMNTERSSSFGAARSVFGATAVATKKSPVPEISGTDGGPASWRSRLQSRDRTASSSSSSVLSRYQAANEATLPSKRIGERVMPKSPGRSIRKLNISVSSSSDSTYRVKPEKESTSTTTSRSPPYRVRPAKDEISEVTKLEIAAEEARKEEEQKKEAQRARKHINGRPSWRSQKSEAKEEEKEHTSPSNRQSSWRNRHNLSKQDSSRKNTEKKENTISVLHNSWRKGEEHKDEEMGKPPVSPTKAPLYQRQQIPLSPTKTPRRSPGKTPSFLQNSRRKSEDDGGDKFKSPNGRQNVYQKALSLEKTNMPQAPLSPPRSPVKIPSFLQNSCRKDNGNDMKKGPDAFPNSLPKKVSSPKSTQSIKSPLKSPRRIVAANQTPKISTSPLRRAPSPTRDSPIVFQSPKRRVSPVRISMFKSPMIEKLSIDGPEEPTVYTRGKPTPASNSEHRAATCIQTSWRRFHQRRRFLVLVKYQRKINKLQKKLVNVETAKQKELGEIQKIVKDYKTQVKAKAEKKRANMDKKATEAAELEKKIAELKKENAQIQAKNEILKKNARNLRINNLRLEKSAESSSEYYEQLKLHHDRCVEDNQKLSKVEDNYKKKVTELEDNLSTRTRYARAEHRIRAVYRKAIQDMVSLGEETFDERLLLTLYQIQERIEDMEEKWKEPEPLSPTTAAIKEKIRIPILLPNGKFLSLIHFDFPKMVH